MASADEMMEAMQDFQTQCNENKRLRRMQRDWTKVIHYLASDTGDNFTQTVVEGETTKVEQGSQGTPDIIVESSSEILCDMFWGDANPTQLYLKGELKVKASQEDVMRLDAVNAVIWPDV